MNYSLLLKEYEPEQRSSEANNEESVGQVPTCNNEEVGNSLNVNFCSTISPVPTPGLDCSPYYRKSANYSNRNLGINIQKR